MEAAAAQNADTEHLSSSSCLLQEAGVVFDLEKNGIGAVNGFKILNISKRTSCCI